MLTEMSIPLCSPRVWILHQNNSFNHFIFSSRLYDLGLHARSFPTPLWHINIHCTLSYHILSSYWRSFNNSCKYEGTGCILNICLLVFLLTCLCFPSFTPLFLSIVLEAPSVTLSAVSTTELILSWTVSDFIPGAQLDQPVTITSPNSYKVVFHSPSQSWIFGGGKGWDSNDIVLSKIILC